MSLNDYLLNRNININYLEGFSQQIPEQTKDLISLCKDCKLIIEIGFNAGHSSETFLKNSKADVLSFDIGYHQDYLNIGKNYIDNIYPDRHSLIIGDSTVSIPKFKYELKADLIFIDGGHSYEVATADLLNCKKFSHKDTIVILDDTHFNESTMAPFNRDVNKAWENALTTGLVTEIKRMEYSEGRGMSWGKYLV